MAKNYEVMFKVGAQMTGAFAKTFTSAGNALNGFSKNIVDLNQKAAQVDKVVKLRKETGEAARAYTQAKLKVAELGKAIHSTSQPTAEMTAEFNKAKQALDKAKNSLDKKRASLKQVEQAAGTTEQSLQSLIQRQNQLAASAEKARISQEKLAKATEMQSKLKGMASSSAMALGGMAAAATPAVLTVKAAMDFEDARAEIGKYSDDSANIFKGIEKLTGKYSKTAADMTAMACNAMQAGIAKTKEDVLTLVESQTQAAVAFGMTGDAVGSAWADIQSKMQTSVSETKGVFDIVNKLGNETSASSEDILQVLQRQGGAVKSLTALNEKQVAAMAGAFRSASTSSEVAATSMGAFIGRLTAGSAATKKQKDAFAALGLDAEDMAKRMTGSAESAQAAIQDVFARIGKLSKDKQSGIIGNLFGNEAGIKSAVATLAGNSKMLGDNLKMIGDSANYSGSMFKEYTARANTTSEALGIARNQLTLISARIGQALLPAVKSLTTSFISITNKVATYIENNKGLVTTLLKVTGIVAGVIAGFHVLRIAVAGVLYPVLSVYKAFQLIQVAMSLYKTGATLAAAATLKEKVALVAVRVAALAWKGVMALCTAAQTVFTAAKNGTLGALVAEKVGMIASSAAMVAHKIATIASTVAQWALNAAFWACPITWIVAGIMAVIAIGILLWKNWDKIKAKTVELWQSFQEKFPAMATLVKLATLPMRIAMQAVMIVFKLLKAAGIALWNGLKWCWNGIKTATIAVWNQIQQPLMNAWNKIKEFGAYVWGTFKNAFISAWQGIRDKISGVFSGLVGIVKGPMNAVISLVNKAIGAINKINIKLPQWAGGGNIGFNIPKIPQLAEGGIATKPTMAMIGEGNESEAVLPLSKLSGMLSGGAAGSGGGIVINFNPTINVSGGSNDAYAGVKRGLEEGARNLKQELEKLIRNQQRLSYT